MNVLKIIIASTRPGRKGPSVANWIFDLARLHTEFNVELIDLASVNLPFLDEPHHPRLQKYQHPHTKDWSSRIQGADAFIFVTPEYNYGYPAPLKNAIDFLFHEWAYKPVALVSYGGVSAGTRSAQDIRGVLGSLKMVTLTESVNIPFFSKHIDDKGNFNADESLKNAAETMMKELLRWTDSLKMMRNHAH